MSDHNCKNDKSKRDEHMTMIKEKMGEEKKKIISHQELRRKFIQETIKENRVALKRLS